MFRRVSVASLALALALVTGCSGSPGPVETTPGFATEEEAFAAAEATYRAYVDALNQVDLSDPATFEPVFALTTGEANADFRRSFSKMHADGSIVSGDTNVLLVEPTAFARHEVDLAVCIDVSSVNVVSADGFTTVDPDRPDVQAMLVTLRPSSGGIWKIAKFNGRGGEPLCVD